jgi:prepilin-type N-terminal cleavage/methylation domain-containing protein
MFKQVQKARKNQKGFTLVELMVVVVIIGILVAIAIPVYNSVTENAQRKAVASNHRILTAAVTLHQAEFNGASPTTVAQLERFFDGTLAQMNTASPGIHVVIFSTTGGTITSTFLNDNPLVYTW